MRKQKPQERIRNFFEVALGMTEEEALAEAKRCLQCKKPFCVEGCPVEIEIPEFIKLISEGKPREALEKIKEKNNLPAVCGRVCPQENQCELKCVLNKKGNPIDIGALERYAADCGIDRKSKIENRKSKTPTTRPKSSGFKVAVVGSGPAGLTAAADLAKIGYSISLFESLHLPGGVLMYGIPEFRLPKQIVLSEVDYIKSLGVGVEANILIGKTHIIDELFAEGYEAILLATGAGLPQFLGIPGENSISVYSANEFLTRNNLMKSYLFPEYATPLNIGNTVAVIGAGNVAFDCARVSIRLGKKVYLVYRRSESEMPARHEEVENAKDEGLIFNLLTQPVEILRDENGKVKGLKCLKMQLGEPDASGRPRPIPIKGSEFTLSVDTVIVAVGQSPNPLIAKATSELKTNEDGTVWIDKATYMTSIPGVFAAGDIVTGADTVISAMGAAKKAAVQIDKYIKSHN
ncbi:MAG: NADPH-dependent glutamate synthase [Candidatus Omnitrophota bacterium]